MLSQSNPKDIQALNHNRNIIRSKTGGWRIGEGIYSHGYSILDELVGKKSYFQVMILNATGKLVDRNIADWVEAIYGCLSWPDSRIWCNQIGALAGESNTTTVAAITAGILAADSTMYGSYPVIEGTRFIQSALKQFTEGLSVKDIIDNKVKTNRGKLNIMGYARPIANGDERIEAMERVTQELGFTEGPHLTLAYNLEKEIKQRFDDSMNINGYVTAFLSDHMFSAHEIYQIFSTVTMSGVTACYLDTLHKPHNSFLPLRCDDIDYNGVKKRSIE